MQRTPAPERYAIDPHRAKRPAREDLHPAHHERRALVSLGGRAPAAVAALLLGLAAGGCGEETDEPVGPPVPTPDQLASTAERIDDLRGTTVGPIGTMMWQFGNLGAKKGTAFFSDGSQADIYRKPGATHTKLNEVEFPDVVLYFGDSRRLRVIEIIRRGATLDECTTARAAVEKEIGLGMPDGPERFTWTGEEYRGEIQWLPDAMGGPWCRLRYQAADDVQLVP